MLFFSNLEYYFLNLVFFFFNLVLLFFDLILFSWLSIIFKLSIKKHFGAPYNITGRKRLSVENKTIFEEHLANLAVWKLVMLVPIAFLVYQRLSLKVNKTLKFVTARWYIIDQFGDMVLSGVWWYNALWKCPQSNKLYAPNDL